MSTRARQNSEGQQSGLERTQGALEIWLHGPSVRLWGAGAALPQGFVGILPIWGTQPVECVHSLIDTGCLCDWRLFLRSWTNCLNVWCFCFCLSCIEHWMCTVSFCTFTFVCIVSSLLTFPLPSCLYSNATLVLGFVIPSAIELGCFAFSQHTLSHFQHSRVEVLGEVLV